MNMDWINPSFGQYLLINWGGGIAIMLLMMIMGVGITATFSASRSAAARGGAIGTGCLMVIGLMIVNILFLVFNAYSLYLLFTQDRTRDFGFWVLVVLYALSFAHRLLPRNDTNVKTD